jgi:hypothetical protein
MQIYFLFYFFVVTGGARDLHHHCCWLFYPFSYYHHAALRQGEQSGAHARPVTIPDFGGNTPYPSLLISSISWSSLNKRFFFLLSFFLFPRGGPAPSPYAGDNLGTPSSLPLLLLLEAVDATTATYELSCCRLTGASLHRVQLTGKAHLPPPPPAGAEKRFFLQIRANLLFYDGQCQRLHGRDPRSAGLEWHPEAENMESFQGKPTPPYFQTLTPISHIPICGPPCGIARHQICLFHSLIPSLHLCVFPTGFPWQDAQRQEVERV